MLPLQRNLTLGCRAQMPAVSPEPAAVPPRLSAVQPSARRELVVALVPRHSTVAPVSPRRPHGSAKKGMQGGGGRHQPHPPPHRACHCGPAASILPWRRYSAPRAAKCVPHLLQAQLLTGQDAPPDDHNSRVPIAAGETRSGPLHSRSSGQSPDASCRYWSGQERPSLRQRTAMQTHEAKWWKIWWLTSAETAGREKNKNRG